MPGLAVVSYDMTLGALKDKVEAAFAEGLPEGLSLSCIAGPSSHALMISAPRHEMAIFSTRFLG